MDYQNQECDVNTKAELPTVAQPRRRLRLKQKLFGYRGVTILPYRGHGTRNCLQIKGRVIESPSNKSAIFTKRSEKLQNFFTMIRNLRSTALPGALLEAQFRGRAYPSIPIAKASFWLIFGLMASRLRRVGTTLSSPC